MQAQQKVAEIKVRYSPIARLKQKIKCSEDAFQHLLTFYPKDTLYLKEHFYVMYMDNQNCVLGIYKLSEGGMTGTVADIRIILSIALKIAAKSIIISHNHPSGADTPSIQDKAITQNIKNACELLELKLHDHIIVCNDSHYFSFGDQGLM